MGCGCNRQPKGLVGQRGRIGVIRPHTTEKTMILNDYDQKSDEIITLLMA